MWLYKKIITVTMISVFIFSFFSFSYAWLIDLNKIKNKQEENQLKKKIDTIKNIKKQEKKTLKFRQEVNIDNLIYSQYKKKINKQLEEYHKYIEEKRKEKRKEMEDRLKYLKEFNHSVQNIKEILSEGNKIYAWFLYLPKDNNLIFFRYNWMLYFTKSYDYKIETKKQYTEKEINNFTSYRIKELKKYNKDEINDIKDLKEFKKLKETIWLTSFEQIKNNINIYADNNTRVSPLYPVSALKEAVKEKFGVDLYKDEKNMKWIYVFFVLNNYWKDTGSYIKSLYWTSIKVISNIFLTVWINDIGTKWFNNTITNNFSLKEFYLPIKAVKKQEITIIQPKSFNTFDIIIFIWILLVGGVIILIWIKKFLWLYSIE